MSSAPSPEEIARDARWLVQALDPASGVARLVEMDRDAYRDASFLDDRILQQRPNAHLVPWSTVAGAIAPGTRCDARWIFHIGHVGSTLVSRLIGELGGILALREPRILRDLAVSPAEVRSGFLPSIPPLLSRSFGPDETTCVKATSLTSEIAHELVPANQKALFMFVGPQAYIPSILAGDNSRLELRMLADHRAKRMRPRVGTLGNSRHSEAHLAAAAWACEMTALEASAQVMADRRVLWANFDVMLTDMAGWLGRVAAFFGIYAAPERLREVAAGPLMGRYSKALEYDYSPALRREVIARAAIEHDHDIRQALAMLEDAAQDSPLLATALSRSNSEA